MWSIARAEVRRSAALLALVALACNPRPDVAADGRDALPQVGPRNGTLVLAGGGALGHDVMGRFIELAGGPHASIVVIPTASEEDHFDGKWPGLEPLKDAGARNLSILHTRDRKLADSDSFAAKLRSADAVWFPGGRQWRLADAYLDTRTHEELRALLERGGVIGGTSAGASIQPSFMVRGAPEGNHIVVAEGHERGLGLLRDVAVDQHLVTRKRMRDLLDVIADNSKLLGIGLDEGTAIVVRGDTAEVIGRSVVAFYNARDTGDHEFYLLSAGDLFDLKRRVTLRGIHRLPEDVELLGR